VTRVYLPRHSRLRRERPRRNGDSFGYLKPAEQNGIVERIDAVEQQVAVRFDERLVKYDFGELDEISLAYAITIHKSQGSEFAAVVIPLATQHYMLLQRNLIYTGITRGKRLLVLVGQKKALGIAVRNDRPQRRYSGLLASLRSERRAGMD
jgi:exodeoxyribonuclease V alpha subunit